MDVEAIRLLRRADPFKPFRLVLRDGRELPVERPSYLAISPTGVGLVHASVKGGFELLSVNDVQDAVVDQKLQMAGSPAQ